MSGEQPKARVRDLVLALLIYLVVVSVACGLIGVAAWAIAGAP
jgi:hypothetical protein